MTMRAALKNSSNRAAVRMLQEVGISTAVSYADRLGLGAMPGVPSLALGSGEVTLMSMAAAFAAFANEGFVPTPLLITRVEDADGQVLYRSEPALHRAISETTAYLMSNMLADVVNSGTAWPARQAGFTLPAAGKTGTTNDYRDAWFVGYTPSLVAGVWVGYDMPQTIVANGYAAQLAVPIWGRFMKTATRGDKAAWLKAPSGITTATICRLSGALARDSCRDDAVYDDEGNAGGSNVYTEYFIRGTEPTTYCPIHDAYEPSIWRFLTGGGADRSPVASRERQPEREPDSATERRTAEEQATVGDAAQPPVVAGGVVVPPVDPPASPEPRRRGFWGRLFGLGGGDAPTPKPVPVPTPRTR
jgi:penicillin-binding protein 1A